MPKITLLVNDEVRDQIDIDVYGKTQVERTNTLYLKRNDVLSVRVDAGGKQTRVSGDLVLEKKRQFK